MKSNDINWKKSFQFQFLNETIGTSDDKGSFNLFDFDTNFIDADVIKVDPGKQKIIIPELKLEKLKQTDLKTNTKDTTSKINADKILMDDIVMDGTTTTSSAPALFGATIPVNNPFGAQDMSINNTKISHFSIPQIRIPSIIGSNMMIEGINVDKVTSDGFTIKGHFTSESQEYNLLDMVSLWASINIHVTVRVDGIEHTNLDGKISSDNLQLNNITMDLNVKNMQINDLKIIGFDVPNIGIGL